MSDQIIIKANGTALKFNVDPTAQESLIDELNAGSKVGPMHNFLTRTVDASSKEDLKPFLKVPAFVMQIGEKVIEASTPTLKLTVGGVERIASGIEDNALAQMRTFSHKWFPGRPVTVRSMGEAQFLEKDFWEKQRIAVASGVAMGFK